MSAILSSGELSAEIHEQGAELKSLKKRTLEYLWQGDPSSWGDSSPQLFPVIGMTPGEGWRWKDGVIRLGNHGFARKSLFETVKKDSSSVLFRLKDSPETRLQYPFSFVLEIRFSLSVNSLLVEYAVENPSEEGMLFSLGAHPGFNCPLEQGLSFSDYYLEFNRPETAGRRMKADFLTGEVRPLLKQENRLDLDYSLFEEGAIILSGLRSDSAVLKSDRGERSIKMDFQGYPHFGIWTKAGAEAPYVCLEPWFGIDSTLGDSPDFARKEGLVRLEGGGRFECSYTLTPA